MSLNGVTFEKGLSFLNLGNEIDDTLPPFEEPPKHFGIVSSSSPLVCIMSKEESLENKKKAKETERKIERFTSQMFDYFFFLNSNFFKNYSREMSLIGNDLTKCYGYYKKVEVPDETTLVIHADFHGNLSSLQHYAAFVDQMRACSSKIKPIILGDLVDRGTDSWATLLEAGTIPGVEIIRGNHENLAMNKVFLDPEDELCFSSDFFYTCIEKVYSLLPMGLFVSSGSASTAPKEYLLCTHGAFETDSDFVSFLESSDNLSFFSKKTIELSSRIQELLQALPPSFIALDVDPDLVLEYLENRQYSSQEIRMICAALQVDLFMRSPSFPGSSEIMQEGLQKDRNTGDHSSLCGRILPSTKDDFIGENGLHLSQRTVLAFLILQSSEKVSLKGLLRGHEHVSEDFKCTLPAYTLSASEFPFLALSEKTKDSVLVLKVKGPKIAQWESERWVLSEAIGSSGFVKDKSLNIGWLS